MSSSSESTSTLQANQPEPSTQTSILNNDAPSLNGAQSTPNVSSSSSSSSSASSASRSNVRRAPASESDQSSSTNNESNVNAHENGPSPIVLLSIEAPNGKVVKVESTPHDSVLDVRSFLLDCPETCDLTCYHLDHAGIPLHDLVELAAYPQLCDGKMQTLKIVQDFYDERSARLHVRRFRELLVSPPAHIEYSLLPALEEKNKDKPIKKEKSSGKNKNKKAILNGDDDHTMDAQKAIEALLDEKQREQFPLNALYEDKKKQQPVEECVKSIMISGWNPPPGNRRLRGDLLYLSVETLENVTVHITCTVDGFHVNDSSDAVFSPVPSERTPYKSHSLLDLVRRLSPQFATRFDRLLKRTIHQHPLAAMANSQDAQRYGVVGSSPSYALPWLQQEKSHVMDWNRAEDAALGGYGLDSRGITRDWNEEYQSCRELPANPSNPQDRLIRDRTLYRIYADFVDAATKAAVAIIHGHIPPVNPLDAGRQHVFIYNNIFFSFAIDTQELLEGEVDKVTHQMASHDLAGIQWINSLDMPDIYTIATALIDYRGHRVIAQSIIPGIFHGDRVSKHVYGSMDQGQTIEAKESFHQLVNKLTKKLHISPHTVYDKDMNAFTIATCMDSKGIVGSDGRSYLLDLFRVCPRDANYSDYKTHPSALLRRELITFYCRKMAMEALFPTNKQSQSSSSSSSSENEKEKKKTEEEKEHSNYMETLNNISFNPDVFTHANLGENTESVEKDREAVRAVSNYLVNEVIPELITSFKSLDVSPIDGDSLTQIMHSRGINMRYLGRIAKLSSSSELPHIANLCIHEMITRACKHLLSNALRDIFPDRSRRQETWHAGPVISRFLSSLVGVNAGGNGLTEEQLSVAKQVLAQLEAEKAQRLKDETNGTIPNSSTTKKNSKKQNKQEKIRLNDGRIAPSDPFHPANLWQSIRELVNNKYGYELPNSIPMSSRTKLCFLRSLCKKAGIQLRVRSYDFSSSEPITIDDMLDLQPVVKAHWPRSADAADLLESGRAYLAQSGRVQAAFQYLVEALSAHTQIYGPTHRDTAECYSSLAFVCYQAADINQALDHQQRALVVLERVAGADHHDTAYAHMNMALYYHEAGHIEASLVHIEKATLILELIAGVNHPDTAAAHLNTGILYQGTKRFQSALGHIQSALDRTIACLGENHLQTALAQHSLAIAQYALRNFRASITAEKQSKSIFVQALGGSHARVAHANAWLNHFTACAVKAEQGQQEPVLPLSLSASSPLSWVSLRSVVPNNGKLSLNEVLSFIESQAARQDQVIASSQQQPDQQQQPEAAAQPTTQ